MNIENKKINSLQVLLNKLESKIPDYKKTNPKISNSTIGWQIEHSLKTILLVANAIKNSKPENYKWKFNKVRLLLSITNTIPRGKVRAPKLVLPDDIITEETLKKSFQKVKQELSNWENLPKNAHFTHPFFGDLNKKQTEWFLNLHTKHHLKIINDICNKI
jgi:hypothetical protein